MNKKKLQLEYCRKHNTPFFAPRNGICYSCGENIFKGITESEAKNTLITGCPYCNYSFVS